MPAAARVRHARPLEAFICSPGESWGHLWVAQGSQGRLKPAPTFETLELRDQLALACAGFGEPDSGTSRYGNAGLNRRRRASVVSVPSGVYATFAFVSAPSVYGS